MRVLLADDHAILLEGLQNLLQAHHIEVVGAAKDGLEAAALARTVRPDVILMDIRMPGGDGLSATRIIKAEIPEVKIIILTTSGEDDDLFEAVRSGATGYLLKSIDAESLIEALHDAHEGIPPFTPGMAAKLLAEFARPATAGWPAPPPPEVATVDLDDPLTVRQQEVLALVAQGLSYQEIGACVYLSPRTVKYHMAEIMRKLHLQNRAQVLAYAGRMAAGGDRGELA